MAIQRVILDNARLDQFGLKAVDYRIGDDVDGWKQIAIMDLAAKLATDRAHRVRDELAPLTSLMRSRNRQSEKYGEALAGLNLMETSFKDDDSGGTSSTYTFAEAKVDTELLKKLGYEVVPGERPTKAQVQEYLQAVKAKIDSLNNRSQLDMNRAQSLIEASDGSYETASSEVSAFAEAYTVTINAMGA